VEVSFAGVPVDTGVREFVAVRSGVGVFGFGVEVGGFGVAVGGFGVLVGGLGVAVGVGGWGATK